MGFSLPQNTVHLAACRGQPHRRSKANSVNWLCFPPSSPVFCHTCSSSSSCRLQKLLLGLHTVRVLLKIIFDDLLTCFKGEIQRLTPPAKRAFWALFRVAVTVQSGCGGPEWLWRSRVAVTVPSGCDGPEWL